MTGVYVVGGVLLVAILVVVYAALVVGGRADDRLDAMRRRDGA